MFHTLRLGEVLYQWHDAEQWARSLWPDGLELRACPHPTEVYRTRALARGYEGPDPSWEMCRAHDLRHHALMQLLGYPHSPTLRAAAEGAQWEQAGREEALVAAVECWLNGVTPEPPAELYGLSRVGEVYALAWDRLRRRVRG